MVTTLYEAPRWAIGLVSIALTLACGRGARAPDPETAPLPHVPAQTVPQPSMTSSAPRISARPLCEEGQAQCSGRQARRICTAKGVFAPEPSPCAQGTRCLDGVCVEPTDGVSAEQMQTIGPEGWLNGWSRLGPMPLSELEELLSGDPRETVLGDAHNSWRTACGRADRLVEVLSKRKRDPKESKRDGALLAGYLISGVERDVWLKVGVMGDMTLWAGTPASPQKGPMHVQRDAWAKPHPDEQAFAIRLKPGLNPVVIALKRLSRWPVGLRIRLRGSDGQTPPGVRFAPMPNTSPCTLRKQLAVQVTQRMEPGQLAFDLDVHIPGLAPPNLDTLELEGRFATSEGQRAPGQCTPVEWSVARGRARTTCQTPADAREQRRLVLTVAGKPIHQRVVEIRPEAQGRWLAARPALIEISDAISAPTRDSVAHLAATIEALLTTNDPDDDWLADRLDRAEQLQKALQAGRDPYGKLRGVVRRAYRSKLDGTLQPYVAWI
ncbi:MAG: hypothetical protein AAFX99_26780, partial [Myxococcota bacterium]